MSEVWCYVERFGGGAAIRSVRLVDAREERVWNAPAASANAGTSPEAFRIDIGEAAAWIAGQLGDRIGAGITVCLDVDAARCTWLSAPSAEDSVIKAAVDAAAMSAGDEGGPTGTGALWAPEAGQPGIDLTVQALGGTATATQAAPASNGKIKSKTSPGAALIAARQRLAVLAVPDLAARLLLDELDERDVLVTSVTSLWHAMAGSLDPARAAALNAGSLAPVEGERVVSGSEPVTGLALVEPMGKLVWAWSREGELLAAGSMRLARSAMRTDETENADGEKTAASEVSLVEVTRDEIGRLTAEWLAWSVQLGVAPARVAVIGPMGVTCAGLKHDLPEMSGVAAAAREIATRWPGAAATGAIEEDPVRSVLMRLAGASRGRTTPEGADAAAAEPGSAIVSLSNRARKTTRRMYTWSGAATAAAALLLGVAAFKIDRSAAAIRDQSEAQRAERAEALKKVKAEVPRAENDADPIRMLRTKIAEMEKQKQQVVPERPVLMAWVKMVEAASKTEGLKVKGKMTATSSLNVTATFSVKDAETGPKFLLSLREITPASLGIDWQGQTTGSGDSRQFVLTGFWREIKAPAAPALSTPVMGSGGTP